MTPLSAGTHLGAAAWAVGICTLAGLVAVCVTCLLLARMPDGVKLMRAFRSNG